jgi:hypothetical protein
MDNTLPIIGYRVFFPDTTMLPEDFSDVHAAWKRRCDYLELTGQAPYVHTLYLGGPEVPVLE